MTAREYRDEFGAVVVVFDKAFEEMGRDQVAAARIRLLDRIAAEEDTLAERRKNNRKRSESSSRALKMAHDAARAVEATEMRLTVLKRALEDSLNEATS